MTASRMARDVSVRPGHDAEVIGDQACVVLDWGQFGNYAKRT